MLFLTLVIQFCIGVLFVFLSFQALTGAKYTKEKMVHLKLPPYFRYVTGFVQLTGGLLMLIGIGYSFVAVVGGLWVMMIMLFGIVFRIRANESIKSTSPAIIIVILSITICLVNLFNR